MVEFLLEHGWCLNIFVLYFERGEEISVRLSGFENEESGESTHKFHHLMKYIHD